MILSEIATTTQLLMIYGGRFQPFHKGHKAVYDYLISKYDNVYIATSNKIDLPRSPFSFEEKKKMMELTGMDTTNVVLTKSPYQAMEITQNFDPENTILMFAVSEKDMAEDPRFSFKPKKDGSPSYFQSAKDGNLETMDKHGYIITVPTFKFKVLGKPMTSSTEIRSSFANMNTNTKKQLITDLFGNYSDEVFNLMSSKITEDLNEDEFANHPWYQDALAKYKAGDKSQLKIMFKIRKRESDREFPDDIGDIHKWTDDEVEAAYYDDHPDERPDELPEPYVKPVPHLKLVEKTMQHRKIKENKNMSSLNDKKIINYYKNLLVKSKKNWKDSSVRLSPLQDTISKFSHSGNDTTKIKKLISGLKENKNMSSQKLGVFTKGKNKVSIWEHNGTIVLVDKRSQRLQETKSSVSEAVNLLYDKGYVCESVNITSMKNAAGAIMNVFFDTIKKTTTVRDQQGGSHTYEELDSKIIAALQKKGFNQIADDNELSLVPLDKNHPGMAKPMGGLI